jgi:glycosyltransferase involved in cell wall biosynthesis
MRIIHFIPSLVACGAERQLAYLAVDQVRIGHDVHVVVLFEGELADRLRAGGVKIHRLRLRGKYDPRAVWEIYCLIESLQPDIIHTWLLRMDVIAGAAALASHRAWVLSEQASGAAYNSPLNRLRAFVARGAAAVDANSVAGADYWAAVSPHVPRYVIPSAVPVDEIATAAPADRNALQLRAGVPVVLYAGRFVEQKNVLRIPPALEILFRQREAFAVLFGNGPLLQASRDLTRSAGIKARVRFPGFTTDLWNWMKMADIFLSPSLFEGRPNAVMEAAVCRCPLVVSDIPEHREFLDDRSALLVPADDVRAISTALMRVIDHPSEAAERAARAFHAVTSVTMSGMTASVDALYRDVLRGRSR